MICRNCEYDVFRSYDEDGGETWHHVDGDCKAIDAIDGMRDVNGNVVYFINVYSIERCYGGPEEGGWWYDTGEPILTQVATSEEDAMKATDKLREEFARTGKRYSVLGGEDYDVYMEFEPGKPFPESRPYYE